MGICATMYITSRKSSVLTLIILWKHLQMIYTLISSIQLSFCNIMNVPFHLPLERVPHRWLSAYDVTKRSQEILDPLTVFYFAWVDTEYKNVYEAEYLDLLKNVPKGKRKRIYEISGSLKKKSLTKEGKDRKKRLVDKLFYKRQTLGLYMAVYLDVLPMFKSFVLVFEQKVPLIHRLSDEQMDLMKSFLSCFVKHKSVKDLSGQNLLDLVVNLEIDETANLKLKYNEKNDFKEKELCFIIYKCYSSKAKICMKKLTESAKITLNERNLHKYFVFDENKKWTNIDIFS